ncbi:cytochrome P450 [Actinomadura rubrisoli]|uniref:Cytochrome P450 n=1 Tax=Actinomadura rubrisoli TaxID=2530368 RepID=A0A4R4ZXN1_9ACTN|nr:cytochrome P450 [Actinomadura rubrisoli]TDD63745.1 cytochrome P450 [Actinomadura rubrisoli]
MRVTNPRLATRDVTIGDVLIPAGSMVAASLIAANHDPEVVADPQEMDFGRPDNKHVAFGHGTHFCLGVHLARAELRVALDSLARRFPGLRPAVAPSEIPWRKNSLFHGPSELPVTW